MGFYRQDYWSEVPCFPPGDLPNPGIEPISLTSPALPDGFFTTSATTYPNVKRLFPLCILQGSDETPAEFCYQSSQIDSE